VKEVFDPIVALREAGFPVDQLSSAQQDVLAALTEEETAILASVELRLREAEGEVSAHDFKLL
jgi:hypothetical protein